MWIFFTEKQVKRYMEDYFSEVFERHRFENNSAFDIVNENVDELWTEVDNKTRDLYTLLKKIDEKIERRDDILQTTNSDVKEIYERVYEIEKNGYFTSREETVCEMKKYIETIKRDIVKEVSTDVLKNMQESNSSIHNINEMVNKIVDESIEKKLYHLGIEKERLKTEITSQVNAYSSQMEQELINKNQEIKQLKTSIDSLLSHINRQEKEIEKLSEVVLEMKKNMEKASDVHSADETILSMEPKMIQEKPNSDVISQTTPEVIPVYIFGNDLLESQKSINNFIIQTRRLRTQVEEKFQDNGNVDIYLKLIDKCIKKFETLAEKNKVQSYDSDKLANESAKILKQTIVRAMSQEKLKQNLEQYMKLCNVRKLDWKVGKKMENDDYNYLEETVFYDKVSDFEQNNTITEIKQDTYIIDYMEDDNRLEAIIPGIYSIGRYENGKG